MTGILVVGATGLVGSSFVSQFMASAAPQKTPLHILTRRPTGHAEDAFIEHVAPTDKWAERIKEIAPETVFCALGTTMKSAGSKQAFRAVDFELVDIVGKAAKTSGTRHFISISSTMAESGASNFYLKTKGEAEDSLRAAGFDRLDIIRPGLLKGDRQGPTRMGESIGIMLSPFLDMMFHGKLRKYRSIDSDDVGCAVLELQKTEETGVSVHENDAIIRLAQRWKQQS